MRRNGMVVMQHNGVHVGEGVEFRLTVWMSRESGWRARVVAPGVDPRDFVSPFELARFLAWPAAAMTVRLPGGIR